MKALCLFVCRNNCFTYRRMDSPDTFHPFLLFDLPLHFFPFLIRPTGTQARRRPDGSPILLMCSPIVTVAVSDTSQVPVRHGTRNTSTRVRCKTPRVPLTFFVNEYKDYKPLQPLSCDKITMCIRVPYVFHFFIQCLFESLWSLTCSDCLTQMTAEPTYGLWYTVSWKE